VTYFRNALRGEILKWCNALPLMDVDNLRWENLRTLFNQDFEATPTVLSVIKKLPEIRQKHNETVLQYVSTCAKILLELKTKTDNLHVNMQLQLNVAKTAAYNEIEEALRVIITREIIQRHKLLLFT
jgi:hypothetical protein